MSTPKQKSVMTTHDQNAKRPDVIIEEIEPDAEREKMRQNINNILHDDKEAEMNNNDALGTGSQSIIHAEEIVYNSLDQSLVETSLVSNDVLIEQDEDEEEPVGTCTSILATGKRAGQQCGRKCADAKSVCIRHKGK